MLCCCCYIWNRVFKSKSVCGCIGILKDELYVIIFIFDWHLNKPFFASGKWLNEWKRVKEFSTFRKVYRKMQTRPLLRHICYSRSAFEKCAAGKLNALWKYISKFLRDWTFVLQVFKRIKLRNFFLFIFHFECMKKLKYQNLFGKHPFRYWKENFNNIFFCFVIAEPFQNGPFFSFFLVFHSFFSVLFFCVLLVFISIHQRDCLFASLECSGHSKCHK